MIYILGFVIIIVAILVIFFVRLIRNQIQRSRAAAPNRLDPETLSPTEIREVPSRPTLFGTAREVTDRMFVRPPTQQESAYVPFHRRGMAEREVEGEAVVRTADDGDPELPVYSASTLPAPPDPAHVSITQIRRGHPTMFADAPPKYSTGAPVVTTI